MPQNFDLRRVSIIIPFFQKERGILSRAIKSISEQKFSKMTRISIIVVDDQSPVSASNELIDFEEGDKFEIRIVRRPNGGPSAARNTGLDSLPAGFGVIAFMDSDDMWGEGHLERGIRAIELGADFYFDDHMPLYGGKSHFQTLMRPDETAICGLSSSQVDRDGELLVEPLAADADIYRFLGEQAPIAFAQGYLAHMSTLVLRRSHLGDCRFDESLKRAGEDYLYSYELAVRARSVAYSPRMGCVQGRGINMYLNAVRWGTLESIQLLRDNLACVLIMRKNEHNSRAVSIELDKLIKKRAVVFMRGFLRACFNQRKFYAGELVSITKLHPHIWRQILGFG